MVLFILLGLTIAFFAFLGFQTGTVAPLSICTRDANGVEVPLLNRNFEWTIFITPQGFTGAADRQQRRAIESWLKLVSCHVFNSKPPRVTIAHIFRYHDLKSCSLGMVMDTSRSQQTMGSQSILGLI
jgi:hypothetical protein